MTILSMLLGVVVGTLKNIVIEVKTIGLVNIYWEDYRVPVDSSEMLQLGIGQTWLETELQIKTLLSTTFLLPFKTPLRI